MTCGSCKYEWCWICGFGVSKRHRICPLMDWFHILCELYLSITKATWYKCILFFMFILFLISPAIAVVIFCVCFVGGTLGSIGMSIIFIVDKIYRSFRWDISSTKGCRKIIPIFVVFVLMILGISFGIILASALSLLTGVVVFFLGCIAIALIYPLCILLVLKIII